MKKIDPVRYLRRDDKWYLGGGGNLVFAPPFPVWLDYPGFWDKAHYYNLEIEPVFTWTLLDEEGHEIPLRGSAPIWSPATRERMFHPAARNSSGMGITIRESAFCLPNGILGADLDIVTSARLSRVVHLVAWTAQASFPSRPSAWITNITPRRGGLAFTKNFPAGKGPVFRIRCGLELSPGADSHGIHGSEGEIIRPEWRFTPWSEKFHNSLPRESGLPAKEDDQIVYLAVHRRVRLSPGTDRKVSVLFSAASPTEDLRARYRPVSRRVSLSRRSGENWNTYFSSVPYVECSDEFLSRYYWYRWYGLKLNTIRGKTRNYHHPATCEGIGYFRAPISYSAPGHVLENRWNHDPLLAEGIISTFLDNQRDDGGFRGYIDPHYYRQEMFYHANWGMALRGLSAVHFHPRFLRDVYEGMRNYVAYFDRTRDREGSGLYDITNHYETGQEYMHRYLTVNPRADRKNWGEVFRLKGVDVTTYIYELKQFLAWLARAVLHDDRQSDRLEREAAKIKTAVLKSMWNPRSGMFFDVDPRSNRQTKIPAAVCFYPYMTDIVSTTHIHGLKHHLFSEREFWTPFPVPSSARTDDYFSDTPEWKGKRMNCPWNGRTWPMTNSHIADALGQCAVRFHDRDLRRRTAEFILKFIRMMFFDGDPGRPNCFEHYNPLTGSPSRYRGIDDYQHSWVNDLIMKYVAGIRPQYDRLIVDPFPFPVEYALIDNVLVRDFHVRVIREGRTFRVWIDGKEKGRQSLGREFCFPIRS